MEYKFLSVNSENTKNNFDLESLIQDYRGDVAKFIKEFFLEASLESSLKKSSEYFFNPCGKLLRPIICLTFSKDLGFSKEKITNQILPYASALEFIHVSTLIHDDLPAIDNDSERRGVESCHIKFDEATAILTGDILIPIGLEIAKKSTLSVKEKYICNYILTDAFRDVCIGQKLDIENATKRLKINKYKTSPLFVASFLIPLTAFTENEKAKKVVESFALEFGNFYQLIDDFIDVYGSKELRGRKKSSDLRNLKDTNGTKLTKSNNLKNISVVYSDLAKNLIRLEKILGETLPVNLVYTKLLLKKIMDRVL